jgi:hypothetical protein
MEPTENPTLHKSLSAPKESDITIASANLQIDEVSDSVIVQSTWPKIFTIWQHLLESCLTF